MFMFDSWESELTHYGTKGQKWGVRRWQNEDGTFNEAGKERYFGPNGMEKPQMQYKTTPKANGQHKMTAAEQAEYDKRIKEASEAYSNLMKDGSKTTEKKTEAKPSEEKKKEYVPKDTGKSSGKKGRKKKKKDKTAKEKKAKAVSKARSASSSGSSMKSHSVKKAVSRGHHRWETSGAIKESSMNKPVVQVINTFSKL